MSRNNLNHNLWRILITASVILVFGSLITACFRPNRGETLEDNRFLLDTVVSIKLYESGRKDVLNEAFKLITDFDEQLSRHNRGSEISDINSAAAGTAVHVSETTIDLIKTALAYAALSGGSFDPTVGPLSSLWAIGSENPRVPGVDELNSILPLVDYSAVYISDENDTVTLGKEGMALDLGGIAKGWIADRVAEYLINNKESHFLINLGGNVLVYGGKPAGKSDVQPFNIGMQDPFNSRGRYLGVFSLREGSVVSSGMYERYFESGGIRYHHILSTADGYPVENKLAAVTIISEDSEDGDALSTTAFVLGLDDGMALIQSLKGIEAAFVTTDGRVILTRGAADLFKPTDPDLPMEIRDS